MTKIIIKDLRNFLRAAVVVLITTLIIKVDFFASATDDPISRIIFALILAGLILIIEKIVEDFISSIAKGKTYETQIVLYLLIFLIIYTLATR